KQAECTGTMIVTDGGSQFRTERDRDLGPDIIQPGISPEIDRVPCHVPVGMTGGSSAHDGPVKALMPTGSDRSWKSYRTPTPRLMVVSSPLATCRMTPPSPTSVKLEPRGARSRLSASPTWLPSGWLCPCRKICVVLSRVRVPPWRFPGGSATRKQQ